jgi:phosphatidylinositol alpha-mannosyltransferase
MRRSSGGGVVKIAFLQSTLPPVGHGGVAYQVDLLARTMVERGHDITAFTTAPVPNIRPYRAVALRLPAIGPVGRILGTGLAFRSLDLSTFDVVHAHGDAWGISGVPLVRTFHGTGLEEASSATSAKRRLGSSAHYLLELISSFRAPVSTAVSQNTRRFMPRIDYVVPNAIDRIYQPTENRFPDPTVLMVAGLLGGRKRGHLVISAFRKVRRRVPRARLVIVTRDVVDEPGVTVHSTLPTADLAVLFRRSWVLCSASSYEAFGLPLAEAMASGLPVVSTPNPGALEILRDGTLGRIVPPDALADAIVELLVDDQLAANLRSQGIKAAKQYALDHVAERYEAVYREVISR